MRPSHAPLDEFDTLLGGASTGHDVLSPPERGETSDGPPTSRRSMRVGRTRSLRTTLLAVAIASAGVGVMLYPSAASWFSDLRQHDQLGSYAEHIDATDPAVLAARLDAARTYNAGLSGGALHDPFTTAASGVLDDEALDYLGQIVSQPGEIMAELRIPGIAALLPVYQGTSDATLKQGIGHLYGSSLPVGGPGTHAVLTGHRGYPEATMFSNLDRMAVGDAFTITTLGETLTYEVTSTEVVLPDDTGSLAVQPGRDLVTLITCTPTGINTHRLLVHAERVANAPENGSADTSAGSVGFPWWTVGAAGALAAGAVIVIVRRRGPAGPPPSASSGAGV